MKLTKWMTMVVAGAVFSVGALGSPVAAAVEASGSVYLGYFDKYLWRGFNLSESKPVFQPGVDVSLGNFTFSYWSNIQQNDGEATETDITIDYTFSPHELVSVSVGNIFYQLDFGGFKDTNELYLSVGLDTLLAPTLTAYWDYDEAESDGLFFTLSVGHTFEVMDNLGINLGALVSYNQASDYAVFYEDANGDPKSYRDFHNYELGISADYALMENLVLSPSVLYSSGISGGAKMAIDSDWLAGINLSYNF
ncbi:hypothetical protein [Geoalkalibacter sp.]|uniref:hypothetical protein n=1 Tax=Geoalkalibacter sp. TaxID=3041440 RepID=UPI00272E027C|nr:hypothetical protein [Geoalkalibacter sp.]